MIHKRPAIWLVLSAALFVTACAPPATEQPAATMPTAPAVSTTAPAQPESPLSQPESPLSPPESPLSPPVAPISQQSPLRPPVAPATPSGVTGEAPQRLLDAILDDAAARTNLARSELIVLQDQAIIWSDGSLGCPQPDMVYTMALVDGYHVIVQAGDQQLDYRSGNNNNFQLCP